MLPNILQMSEKALLIDIRALSTCSGSLNRLLDGVEYHSDQWHLEC